MWKHPKIAFSNCPWPYFPNVSCDIWAMTRFRLYGQSIHEITGGVSYQRNSEDVLIIIYPLHNGPLQNSHQQEARGKVLVLLKDETINALNSRTAKQWISQTSAGSAFTFTIKKYRESNISILMELQIYVFSNYFIICRFHISGRCSMVQLLTGRFLPGPCAGHSHKC